VPSTARRRNRSTSASPTTTCASGRRRPRLYLKIPCRSSGALSEITADAIHPGYGFLSERAEFAEIVKASNIVFIGPSGEIRQMGDKAMAKKLAQEAGCHGAGLPGPCADATKAWASRRNGFRSSSSGGGRGVGHGAGEPGTVGHAGLLCQLLGHRLVAHLRSAPASGR